MRLLLLLLLAVIPPRPRDGDVGGLQGVFFFPIPESAKPEACTVHLVPNDDPALDIVHPCSRWFVPAEEGMYGVWIEDGERVSASRTVLAYTPAPFANNGFIEAMDTVPAGAIALDRELRAGETFRFSSLTADGYGFERRITAKDATRPLRVPPGRWIAGIYDKDHEAVAFAPIVTVRAGEVAHVTPCKPATGESDLFVILKKRGHSNDDFAIYAEDADGRHPPDGFNDNARFYAVWYGLRGSTARIVVESKTYKYTRAPIALRKGEPTIVRDSLETR
ncbi:MAG: hypothetical protein JOZ54_01000 [Acidobacteria bacterium]|nr:hypothetical protein [Acidobacteriota bacterium]